MSTFRFPAINTAIQVTLFDRHFDYWFSGRREVDDLRENTRIEFKEVEFSHTAKNW